MRLTDRTPMLNTELRASIPEHPPRNAKLLPGLHLSKTIRPSSLILASVLLLLFALAPLAIIFSNQDTMLSLYATKTASGEVAQVQEGRECKGASIDIRYTFKAGDLEYRGMDTACSRSAYAELTPGDKIPITHLADDPSVNAISGASRNEPPLSLLLMIPLFGFALFGGLVLPRFSEVMRDRKLFRQGVLAEGSVIFVTKTYGSPYQGTGRPTQSQVYVALSGSGDSPSEVKAQCSNDWLLTHLPPGARVMVVYDPKNNNAMLVEGYLR